MTTPRVTLIVLAWNHWHLTQRCLETLQATDLGDAEILVVDNGSTDETPKELATWPGIRVLRLPENVGFVRGNNAGIAAAAPDSDIVLLNNDLVFTQNDWLERLAAGARSATDIGVAGCRQVLPDGRLLHAGTYILPDTLWGQQIGALEEDIGQFRGLRTVQGVTFACAYLRRRVIDKIGGLSLDYESYFEDTDYCLRAAGAGFRTVVCGDVTLVHDEHGSTHANDERRLALFQRSQQVFGRRWKQPLEADYRHQVLWQSIMNFPTGYAESCRGILRELDAVGVRASYRYVYGPGTIFPPIEPEESGDYKLDVIRGRDAPRRATSVVYGQGDVFHRAQGRRKVGFTMLEVDGFPAEWVRQANRMDEVWVPSEFNRQGFLDGGVKRPVHLMPLGVEADRFHPEAETTRQPDGDFVFLSTFEWGERKEPWLLLRTFSETFRVEDPVMLICKVNSTDPTVRVTQEIRRLGLDEKGGRIAYLFNLDFPHYQMPALYRAADCYLSISRGEGWNMPLMEAMACGLPSIATDWGAHREFVDERVAYPLRIRSLIPAVAKCPYYDGFRWADPDPDHLRFLLRQVYENRAEAVRRGAAAAAMVRQRFTWRHTAERIAERLAALES